MQSKFILRLVSAAALCVMLAACGGESVAPSSSQPVSVPASSQPEATPEPASAGKQLTAELPVEGTLTLTESGLFNGYTHVSPFFNGWAFVCQNDQVGYLSETGEFKALYSATEDDLIRADFSGLPYFYEPGMSTPRRMELYWLGHTFRYGESGLVPYFQNGKWGYSDLDGNIAVEPVYDQITWLGKLGYGLRSEAVQVNEATGTVVRTFDIFDSNGQVIASSNKMGWADPELGYYMLGEEESSKVNLYNADGSLVTADVPYSMGNCYEPDFDLYSGGIVLNGVAYDRTGAELPVDPENLDLFQADLLGIYDEELQDDIGTDLNGQMVLEAGLWLVKEPDENGCRYMGVQGGSAVRLYDAQFEELPTPPLLRTVKGEAYTNDAGDTVQPVRVLDQDGNEILVLEGTDPQVYPVYCPQEPLVEGGWIYYCPDADTVIPYQVTAQ